MIRNKTLRQHAFPVALFAALASTGLRAQSPEAVPAEPAPPPGQVLFSTDAVKAAPASTTAPDKAPDTPVTDAERSSVAITATDLDLHLAAPHAEAQATLTIRNIGSAPLVRIPLQLSSALRWQSIAAGSASGLRPVPFTQSPIATDTDHTGYAQEAVLTPVEPLAPDATLTLTIFYAGDLRQSAARLELLGSPADRAAFADWDQAAADWIGLRGFGNVLWYPVAAPTALLGDANRLFEVVGQQRLQQESATFHLRLTVEYAGEAPSVAIFNGRTQPLDKLDDTQDAPVAETHGVATADFGTHPTGFRSPSLFVPPQPAVVTGGELLAVVTPISESIEPLAAAAAEVQPLLQDWLGPTPTQPLTVLDHPGQSFEDDALLVTPLDPNATADDLSAQAVHGLAHSWLRSSQPWINEGVAQFMNLLWIERKLGRPAVVAELQHQATLVALAEPDLTTPKASATESSSQSTELGQPLVHSSSEVFFRNKAAAVFWQLRDIVGDDTLKRALQAYRHSEQLNPAFDTDPKAFQHTLERLAKRDLNWFFDDWVYRDRSLPDLTILSVAPRPLPDRPGKNAGYLVAVEVHNEGDAVAEVPVTVRNGTFTATERLRIPGGGTASTRIVFEGAPDQVQVNDGTVPELRNSIHTREVQVKITRP
ncbi:M1 family metallopeptidase [Granulicella sp. WH15]|uniref:M1 family aminopeptidase n=1 Tax=Granulicella sp. WH15 TaxID=2602070 RepID=UPI00136734EC|nr:M1 family aminopeptidase [Granulicella sp. WH15]QHN02270.1 M1 family metallopeptidase [Granulicella sp. WH15]